MANHIPTHKLIYTKREGEGEREENQGMYLTETPVGSVRSLRRDSGTFLFNSLRMWERGLLIPETGTSSSSPRFVSCCSLVLLLVLRGEEEEEEEEEEEKGLAEK